MLANRLIIGHRYRGSSYARSIALETKINAITLFLRKLMAQWVWHHDLLAPFSLAFTRVELTLFEAMSVRHQTLLYSF
jgi:hypothetical protein